MADTTERTQDVEGLLEQIDAAHPKLHAELEQGEGPYLLKQAAATIRALRSERDEARRQRDEWRDIALHRSGRLATAEAALERKDASLREARDGISEAVQQIEYLHEKFQETGSGNTVLALLRALASEPGHEEGTNEV